MDTASFGWTHKDETVRQLLLNAFRDHPDYRQHAQSELQNVTHASSSGGIAVQ